MLKAIDTTALGRWFPLAIFTLILSCNYLDRFLLSILLEPIKTELGISDTQAGLATGAAFALFYSTFAIPIARIAERRNRVHVLGVCLLIWSVATVLCGAVVGFFSLLLSRVLVGIGEAGGIPPTHSMVADLFGPKERATAMSILAIGVSGGATLAPLLGGVLEEAVGWRMTFVIVGLPGIVLALILMLCVREPARGHVEGLTAQAGPPKLVPALRRLLGRPAFCAVMAGLIFMALCEYSLFLWLPTLFRRSFGISGLELGGGLALFQGAPYFVATLCGGVITDRLNRRDIRWGSWAPMLAALMALPAVGLLTIAPTATVAFALLIVPFFAAGFAIGPCYAMIQNLAAVRSRATATAVLVFAVNIIGAGLGPLGIGMLSDGLAANFGEQSLRFAFLALIPLYIAAAASFFIMSRTLLRDLEDAAAESSEPTMPG